MAELDARPAITGLMVYRDPERRYSFLYPEGWHLFDLLSEQGRGIGLSPSAENVATSFSVETRDLGVAVSEEDLPVLRRGFLAGLRKLPAGKIESHEDYTVGALLGLEARHTFREGGELRKRWTRLLYQGSIQARLIAQGASADQFEYWLPFFNQAMRTFRFGDWWAEVTGREWLPSLLEEPPADQD